MLSDEQIKQIIDAYPSRYRRISEVEKGNIDEAQKGNYIAALSAIIRDHEIATGWIEIDKKVFLDNYKGIIKAGE